MLYLAACAVNEKPAETEKISVMDLNAVYALSRNHNLAAITFAALESAYGSELPKNEIINKWRESRDKTIRKNMLLDVARLELYDFLESKGIWHLSLKGIVLKELYPKQEMREMSDNDIFFDKAYQKEVYDWFCAHGYSPEKYKKLNHDSYHKPPLFNFEMHTSLFSRFFNSDIFEYYANAEKRFIAVGESYERRFSDEDFYIHTILHAYKHYVTGGVGVRSLLDCYVYLKAKGDGLDREYINAELEKLKVADFELNMRQLSQKLFADSILLSSADLSPEQRNLLEYHLTSGTHGSLAHRVENNIKKGNPNDEVISNKSRWKYMFSRIFPNKKYMEEWYAGQHPLLYKYSFMLPIAWLHRILSHGIINIKDGLRELKTLWRV